MVNKNGINQLSLRKVAQACGVASHVAPYSHFSNKEELLQEMQLHITKSLQKYSKIQFPNIEGHLLFFIGIWQSIYFLFISHPQYFNFLFQQGNIQN